MYENIQRKEDERNVRTYDPSFYKRGQESGRHDNKSQKAHSLPAVLDKRHQEYLSSQLSCCSATVLVNVSQQLCPCASVYITPWELIIFFFLWRLLCLFFQSSHNHPKSHHLCFPINCFLYHIPFSIFCLLFCDGKHCVLFLYGSNMVTINQQQP